MHSRCVPCTLLIHPLHCTIALVDFDLDFLILFVIHKRFMLLNDIKTLGHHCREFITWCLNFAYDIRFRPSCFFSCCWPFIGKQPIGHMKCFVEVYNKNQGKSGQMLSLRLHISAGWQETDDCITVLCNLLHCIPQPDTKGLTSIVQDTFFLPENSKILIFTISVKLEDKTNSQKSAHIGLAQDLILA